MRTINIRAYALDILNLQVTWTFNGVKVSEIVKLPEAGKSFPE